MQKRLGLRILGAPSGYLKLVDGPVDTDANPVQASIRSDGPVSSAATPTSSSSPSSWSAAAATTTRTTIWNGLLVVATR
jgi:hypothetical protein